MNLDRINVYLQAAHLQASKMRADAIENGDRKGRWFAEGQRDAIEAALKAVNEPPKVQIHMISEAPVRPIVHPVLGRCRHCGRPQI